MNSNLVANSRGGYHFLPGIAPYSSGVIADCGREIVRVTIQESLPWATGLHAAKHYLKERELNQHSLCGVELRCPTPHSLKGFMDFNKKYRSLLEEWDMLVDRQNPVARTNVAPVQNPPHETMLHAFSYVTPSDIAEPTFVVAGGGELPHATLKRELIVRVGETTDNAMVEKARCVVNIMRQRLKRLDVSHDLLSTIDVYSAHPIHQSFSIKSYWRQSPPHAVREFTGTTLDHQSLRLSLRWTCVE